MDESQLRRRVERESGKLPDSIWQDLVDEQYVQEALDPDVEDFDGLVKVAKNRLKNYKSMQSHSKAPPGRKAHTEIYPTLQSRELTRAQVFSEYLGKYVATIPRVRRLRTAILDDGRILSSEEADGFLASPAIRYLSLSDFRELGIPVVGHRSAIMFDDTEDEFEDAFDYERSMLIGGRLEVSLRIEWERGSYEGRFLYEDGSRFKSLDIDVTHSPLLGVPVWPVSVLGELYDCSVWLASRYPWYATFALRYLLTNDPPFTPPVRLGAHGKLYRVVEHLPGSPHGDRSVYAPGHCRLTLSVDPWVSADTVLKAYRAAQRAVLGRDNRGMGDRALSLLRFMANQVNERGPRPTWNNLMTVWNKECQNPEWRYVDVWRFTRDVGRAERALNFPAYRIPFSLDTGSGIEWGLSVSYTD